MRLLHILTIGCVVFALAYAVPVDDDESAELSADEPQLGWFSQLMPMVRRILGASERDDVLSLPGLAIRKVRDLLVKYAPSAGTSRTSRVLKDSYTVVEFLTDLDSSWQGYVDKVNTTSGRSGRTLFKNFDFNWLLHHNKFNNKVQSKVNSLLNGPESDSLAVGGGIAAGVMGAVGLGLLLSKMKIEKRIDTEGRSSRFDNWEVTNEIDDTIPVVTSLKSAWSRFDEVNKGRTVGEKFDTIYYKFKDFFGQNQIFNRLDSLYRSPAVSSASVYGGVGAGLLGALGLSLLFAGVQEGHKARSRGRALELTSDNATVQEVPEFILNGIDGIWVTFVNELNATAAKLNETAVNGTQGRRARLFPIDESDDRSFNKLKMPVALTNWVQKYGLHTKISDKLGVLYKAKSPVALAGGATAAAVGISGLGLLIAALAKKDKFNLGYDEDYANEYDPSLFEQQPSYLAQQPSYVIPQAASKQQFVQQQQFPQQQQQFAQQQQQQQFPQQQQQQQFAQQQFPQQKTQQQGFFPSQTLPLQSVYNGLEKQDSQPVKKQAPTTTTFAPITDKQLDLLRNAIVTIQEGACSQATLCQSLVGDQPRLAQLAYLAASYDDQLGAFRPSVRALLDGARRRDCTAYKC